jgi:hypothetical protein
MAAKKVDVGHDLLLAEGSSGCASRCIRYLKPGLKEHQRVPVGKTNHAGPTHA